MSHSPTNRSEQLPMGEVASSDDSVDHRFKRLVANSPDLIAIIDEFGNLRYANPAGERMFGYPGLEYVGEPAIDLVHPEDRDRAATALARDLTEPGEHPPGHYRLRVGQDEWHLFEVRASNCLNDPSVNGVIMVGRDVTEQTRIARSLRMLGDVNRALVHASDEHQLLTDICSTIVDVGGYSMAWVGFLENEGRALQPVATAGNVAHLDESLPTLADAGASPGAITTAIRTGSVQVTSDIRASPAPAAGRDAALRQGLLASCVLPLVVAGTVIGIIEVCADELRTFEAEEVQLLQELADSLAYGIGRIRDAISLAQSEERFRSLASASPIGILEVGGESDVRYANPRACEIAGVTPEALLETHWIDVVHPDDRERLLDAIAEMDEASRTLEARFRILRPDGETRHVRMTAAAKQATADTDWVVTVSDESEEVRAHEELAHQALYDTLTDLPNRAMFLDRLRQELAWSERERVSIAVLFLDLDLFKFVNDSLGHDAGDTVLQEVSQRFLGTMRGAETAARFGGDEFMFIIRNVRQVDDAVQAARRLLDSLDSPVLYDGQSLQVTGSIGIVIPVRGADAETVLRDADTAMYQAKSAGRNRYELFDEELHHRSVARLEMEGDLRVALECNEFEVHYQPIVDPCSGHPVGAEALIRWHHPVHGNVPPLEFIPVAEESGLITSIGNWVFEEAINQMAEWDRHADAPHLDLLSVNFSARQLEDVAGARRLGQILRLCGIDAARVDIEVTESVAMADRSTTRASLQALKDLGLRVSIDDFGTGFSSLSHLHTLPVATVKIDRMFIERLDVSDGSTPVVKAILDMSHAMGLRVIAEGVSSAPLGVIVADMGCDLAQGFYWSHALPAHEFAEWWARAMRETTARREAPATQLLVGS